MSYEIQNYGWVSYESYLYRNIIIWHHNMVMYHMETEREHETYKDMTLEFNA